MKSFQTIYNASKQQVLKEKKDLFESQKIAVVKALKNLYMISGKVLDLPKTEQDKLARKVLEYWNPKTGLNKNGQRLLNESLINLSPKSTNADIKKYIQNETRKNIVSIVEAYRTNTVSMIVEAFKQDIQPKIRKKLLEESIRNVMWPIVEEKIKMTK